MSNTAQTMSSSVSLIGAEVRAIISSSLKTVHSFVDQEGKFSIRFQSPQQASDVLEQLYCAMTKVTSRTMPMYWHLDHAWWPLIRPLFCYHDSQECRTILGDVRYLNMGATDVDYFVGSFYQRLKVVGRQNTKRFLPHDTWLLGDLMVTQKFDPSVRGEIEKYFQKAKSHDNFAPAFFVKEFLETKSPFEVEVVRLKDSTLLNTFNSYFT